VAGIDTGEAYVGSMLYVAGAAALDLDAQEDSHREQQEAVESFWEQITRRRTVMPSDAFAFGFVDGAADVWNEIGDQV
jgi:hypothetical protein